jgi:hypothetical protein
MLPIRSICLRMILCLTVCLHSIDTNIKDWIFELNEGCLHSRDTFNSSLFTRSSVRAKNFATCCSILTLKGAVHRTRGNILLTVATTLMQSVTVLKNSFIETDAAQKTMEYNHDPISIHSLKARFNKFTKELATKA